MPGPSKNRVANAGALTAVVAGEFLEQFPHLLCMDLWGLTLASRTPAAGQFSTWWTVVFRHPAGWPRCLFSACRFQSLNFCTLVSQKSSAGSGVRPLKLAAHAHGYVGRATNTCPAAAAVCAVVVQRRAASRQRRLPRPRPSKVQRQGSGRRQGSQQRSRDGVKALGNGFDGSVFGAADAARETSTMLDKPRARCVRSARFLSRCCSTVCATLLSVSHPDTGGTWLGWRTRVKCLVKTHSATMQLTASEAIDARPGPETQSPM